MVYCWLGFILYGVGAAAVSSLPVDFQPTYMALGNGKGAWIRLISTRP